ncbi:AGE family epimerase/isomerase [Labilibacter marinus]|uniref:AGE family epimerase/isomerase n=1 Tax=Labilibacter marinus TaxID=1477105 RepID=UPI00094F4EBD|nr:AGE family epimerase/isomerase [Labilibacter marinus]
MVFLNKYSLLFLVGLVLLSCAQSKVKKENTYDSSIKNSISFFDKAFDNSRGVYLSEVDFLGDTISSKIHTVALSRLIYGLAYSSKYFPENLKRAERLAKFQMSRMLEKDSVGLYFIPEVGEGKISQSESLDIWQQAYGLCGLTELYRSSKDAGLLAEIHHLNEAFIERFRDTENGGFYSEYNLNSGVVSGTKTIQSLMYPITAYMANLWLADKTNRLKYEEIIKEHLSIAYSKVWNDSIGWVNTKFDDKWNPMIESKEKAWVTPGHNFQFAALMLRSAKWPFVSVENQVKYEKMGTSILKETLTKDIWINDSITKGFYGGINPLTNKVLDKNRSWWQHCEALIALSFCPELKEEFESIKQFYFDSFVDVKNGGEIANIDLEGKPIIEPKGQKGKSVYHHIEMLRVLNETGMAGANN